MANLDRDRDDLGAATTREQAVEALGEGSNCVLTREVDVADLDTHVELAAVEVAVVARGGEDAEHEVRVLATLTFDLHHVGVHRPVRHDVRIGEGPCDHLLDDGRICELKATSSEVLDDRTDDALGDPEVELDLAETLIASHPVGFTLDSLHQVGEDRAGGFLGALVRGALEHEGPQLVLRDAGVQGHRGLQDAEPLLSREPALVLADREALVDRLNVGAILFIALDEGAVLPGVRILGVDVLVVLTGPQPHALRRKADRRVVEHRAGLEHTDSRQRVLDGSGGRVDDTL